MKTFLRFCASLAFAFALTPGAGAAIVAGPITNAANGHYYYLLSSNSWTTSEAEAVTLGGHLVTINDATENQWVHTNFITYGGVQRPLWIGLTDRRVEGTWEWVSGEPVTYTNWITGEPNNNTNFNRGPQNWAMMWPPAVAVGSNQPGRWNDYWDLPTVVDASLTNLMLGLYGVVEVAVPGTNLVWIRPGTFTMGSPTNEVGRNVGLDEGPQTQVTLTRGFWMNRFEVTQAEFLAVTGVNPSKFTNDLSRPVEQVYWNQAQAYCALLNQREGAAERLPDGWAFRLPTEAEWEYACRAGTTTPFSFGSNQADLGSYGWHYGNSGCNPLTNDCSLGSTRPVGLKLPNPWGLYDMHGNVGEMVQDWFAPYPGGSVTNPVGPSTGTTRPFRGPAWDFGDIHARSAGRWNWPPVSADDSVGFRVVLAAADCWGRPSDAIARWSGEGNALDSAGSHHGTLQNGTGFAVGIEGQAFLFDGVDDYVSIPPLNFSGRNAITIQAWIKPVTITANRYYEIVRQQSPDLPDWILSFQEFGTVLSFGLYAGDGYAELDVPITPGAFVDGQWHHVAATYDGAAKRVYRDGVEIGAVAQPGNIRFAGTQHAIGSAGTVSEVFSGAMDEVAIFDRALTHGEIAAIHGAGGSGTNCPTLIYTTGFEFGVGREWSRTNVSLTPVGARRFLGEFNNETVRLTLTNLPPHAGVRAEFDLFVIRSWDGDSPVQGPDRWSLRVDGPAVFQTTFNNHHPTNASLSQSVADVINSGQAYPGQFGDFAVPPLTGASEIQTLGYMFSGGSFSNAPRVMDAVYHLTVVLVHSSPSWTLDFASAQAGGLADESWGLDNVAVFLLPQAPTPSPRELLVPSGSLWRYLDNGSNLGTTWVSPDFNDSSWATGRAELGYGDGDEATVVSFGPSATNKYTTTYFRRAFVAANVWAITNLDLGLRRDDGGIVYLNGVEVFRSAMPAGVVTYQTFASITADTANEVNYFTTNLSPALLVEGTNVLAVEIHQVNLTSSDISFDMYLEAELAPCHPAFLAMTNAAGSFTFERDTATVGEDGATLQVTVRRVGGTTGLAAVTCQALDGSAVAGIDYVGGPVTLVFSNGVSVRSFAVPILDDSLPEAEKNFTLRLESPTGGASIALCSNLVVRILDDDGYIEFAQTNLAVPEISAPWPVSIRWTGNTNRSVSAQVRTRVGTAVPNTDYAQFVQTITFAPGQTNIDVFVTVHDDTFVEPDETIILSLGNPTGGAVLPTMTNAIVTILDNDAAGSPGRGANGSVEAIVVQPDGRAVLAGEFSAINGERRTGGVSIVRMNVDGLRDTNFTPAVANNVVYDLDLTSDGKVLAAGLFTAVNGTSRGRVARLNTSGTLDGTFAPAATGANSWVNRIAEYPGGKAVIVGDFTAYDGIGRVRVARLNADGTLDGTFNPGSGFNQPYVWTLAVQTNGQILVGGFFQSYNGTSRNNFVRLNADGGLDLTFNSTNAGPSDNVTAIKLLPDGRVLIGGYFLQYNGVARAKLARLLPNGQLDPGFVPNWSLDTEAPYSIDVQADGRIIVGGRMTSPSAGFPNYIVRLHTNGQVDATFNVGPGANGWVAAVGVLPDDRVVLGGRFSVVNGFNRSRLAFLNADGSQPDEPVNWVQWPVASGGNGHWYAFTKRPNNWTNAEAEAVTNGGHLVSVTASNEQSFLETTFVKGLNRIRPHWTGFSDPGTPGSFRWSSGESNLFTKWQTGEPNGGAVEDFAALNWHFAEAFGGFFSVTQGPAILGSWNDVPARGTVHSSQAIGPYFGIMEILTHPSAPVITQQPQGQSVSAGTNVTFSVMATGAPPLRYQWFFNGANALAGATNADLVLLNVQLQNAGSYSVTVSNAFGVAAGGPAVLAVMGCAPSAPGLIGWWRADGNAQDTLGLHHGTLQGGLGFTPGITGQAFSFDGVNDYVDLGNWFDLQEFTIALWVKPGATQVPYADIIDNNHTAARSFVFQQDFTNANTYYWEDPFPGSPGIRSLRVTFAPDVWQFVAITRTAGNLNRLYLDGVQVGMRQSTNAVVYDSTQFLRLGNWGANLSRPWNGQMDDVMIFDRPLNAAEIRGLRDASPGGHCLGPPGHVVLVPASADWKYLDDGSDQGAAWRAPNFDDSAWPSGPAQLGYGDGDEATVVNGGPANSRFVTTYFRRTFVVPDATVYSNLVVRLLRDDGGVVYLNGVEIFRSLMPSGPIAYNTFASGTAATGPDETENFYATSVPPGLLRSGTNLLAAEIHQVNLTSSDISFDLELLGNTIPRPEFLWARSAGGTNADLGTRLAVDGNGNVFVAGNFQSIARFGSTDLVSLGDNPGRDEVFIAKYGATGDLQWVRQIGGTSDNRANGVAVDAAGNCYVTGSLRGTAAFGGTSLTSAGLSDMFLAKYNGQGVLQWAARAGGSDNDAGNGLAVDTSGNCYVVGTFSATAAFGTTNLTSAGGLDLFVAKFGPAGGLLWVAGAGGALDDIPNAVAADPSGHSRVAGRFQGVASFGPTNLTSAGDFDLFLARYDAAGVLQWVRRAGDTQGDSATAVAADAQGNSFITGVFRGTAAFGPVNLINATNDGDIFVAKFDPAGNALWAVSGGGTSVDRGFGIKADAAGNCYVAGTFLGTADWSGSLLTAAGGSDVFIASYDSAGALRWVQQAGGAGADEGLDIALDSVGALFITGSFSNAAVFGLFPLLSSGGSDVFVAKLAPVARYDYFADFEGAVGSEWSSTNTDVTPVGRRRFLGQFGNQTVTLTLNNLPDHASVNLFFDLYVIRSWDGNGNCCAGIDQWDVRVAGGPTLLHTTFSNTEISGNHQAYPDFYPGGNRPGGAGASESNTLGFVYVEGATVRDPLDSVYRLSFNFPHTSTNLAVQFSASGLQVLTNESWGLDNVRVQVSPSPAPPVIQIGPTNLLVASGTTATFSVTAIGTAPLAYQWLRSGLPLPGATNATLVLSNAQTSAAATYAVLVSNPAGTVTSANAALAVSTSDLVYSSDFTLQPLTAVWTTLGLTGAATDITSAAGVDASVSSFTAPVISGALVLGGDPPVAASSATWSSGGGYVQTRPTNVRLTALMASLVNTTATPAVSFTVSYDFASLLPVTEEVAGQRVYYSLTGASTTWVNIPELSSQAPGRLTATVTLPSLWLSGARLYLVFADDNGSGTPDTANQIDNFSISANAPSVPIILTQPANVSVPVGSNVVFSVAATGFQPLAYQWFFNDTTPLAGATNASLLLSNVQPAQAGAYRVRVSNVAGMTNSAAATLTMITCGSPPAGLVGWWPGDGHAADLADTNHATLDNGASYTDGRVGPGFQFAGFNDAVVIGNPPALQLTNALTLQAWIFPTLGSGPASVVTKWGSSSLLDCYGLWIDGSEFTFTLRGAIGVPGTLDNGFTGGGLLANNWSHVAMTYDAATGQNQLYVNGVQVASRVRTGGVFTSDRRVMFGREDSGQVRPFRGAIDEVAIHNRALTSNEIAAIYQLGGAGLCKPSFAMGAPRAVVNGRVVSGNIVMATNAALVRFETTSSNAFVRYTLNGAPPAGGILFTGAFVLNEAAVVRAMAVGADGFTPAGEMTPLMIDVVLPPVILTPPRGGRVGVGTDLALNVVAAGTEPLAFQWLRDGVPIFGATNALLLLANIQPADGGTNFAVVIANAFGAVTSAPVAVVVFAPPSFLAQPQSVTVGEGGTAMFSVSALGPPPLEFQWRKNGINIPGATNSMFTIMGVTLDDGASYSVVVASPGGTLVSDPARLTVIVPSPPASDNFASTNTLLGASGSATGTNNFATREPGEPMHAGKPGSNSVWYAWTAPVKGIATFRTSGSTFDTLLAVYTGANVSNLTTVASDEDSGGFLASRVTFNANADVTYHIAIDGFNGQQGSFVLRWDLLPTTDAVPGIACPPASLTVQAGQDATFTVTATGDSLSYQWLFNGVEILGATQPGFTRTNVQPQHVGFYSVRVRSTAPQAVVSAPAILEIGPFPGVQSQDKPNDVSPGCPGGFAPATGMGPSVAMGSVGSQLMVLSANNITDCTTTNCGGIPVGTRYFMLEPVESGLFSLSTLGSVSRTKMWVCDAGTSRADPRRTFLRCDVDSAPDGRSTVLLPVVGGRRYEVSIARLDNVAGDLRLAWKFGLAPRFASLSPSQFAAAGSSLSLSASATNVVANGVMASLAPPSYAWYFNGTTLMGTGPTLTLNQVTPEHAGQYLVVAANDLGMTSAVVRVEVYGSIGRSVVPEGGGTELFADATTESCGGTPATYQWRLNGAPLMGETNRSLVLRGVHEAQAGPYSVTVSNCFGTFTYAAATLTVTVDVGFHAELMPGGQVVLRWRTAPARLYRVEQRGTFDSGEWLPFSPIITGNGEETVVTDQMTVQRRFYRIVLLE